MLLFRFLRVVECLMLLFRFLRVVDVEQDVRRFLFDRPIFE